MTETPERPALAPDPLDVAFGAPARPRLGGLLTPVAFTDQQTAVLNAVADTMVPPGGGFPAPSEVDVVGFVGRYVTPSGERAVHYPFAAEDTFKAAVDALGQAFVDADEAGRTAAITALETADETFFSQLRSLVYYGYYASTEVTLAIRKNIPAGRDYHGPPQPYGYLDCIEPWDEEIYSARGGGSGFVETDAVTRVDLSNVSWIGAQREGAQS